MRLGEEGRGEFLVRAVMTALEHNFARVQIRGVAVAQRRRKHFSCRGVGDEGSIIVSEDEQRFRVRDGAPVDGDVLIDAALASSPNARTASTRARRNSVTSYNRPSSIIDSTGSGCLLMASRQSAA